MAGSRDVFYWKAKYEETEKELEEFRDNSQQYERELESTLEQSDKTIKELRIKNNSLQIENDSLKDKLEEIRRITVNSIGALEEEKAQWCKREEDYIKSIRELEQKNDDLERSQRVLLESVEQFDTRMNSVMERNVLLESELDEKEALQAMVQRLKDEARDLKQEVFIREKLSKGSEKVSTVIDSNKMNHCSSNGVAGQGRNSVVSNISDKSLSDRKARRLSLFLGCVGMRDKPA